MAIARNIIGNGKMRQKIIWSVLIATILWLGVMEYASRHFQKPECPTSRKALTCALESPGVELQLARSPAKFKGWLSGNNAEQTNIEAMRTNTKLDFVFIALYSTVFLLFSTEYPNRLASFLRWVISAAAIFDVLENIRLLRAFRDLQTNGAAAALPRAFSVTKWAAFALAVLLLGATIWKTAKSRKSKAIAILLFGAAGFMGLGLFLGSAFITIGSLIIAVPLFAAVLSYAPFAVPVARVLLWVQYLYLLRFEILSGLLLAVVLPAGYWLAASVFVGLFDARAFWSLVFVVWAAVQLAWCIMITSRLVLIYGPDRFVLPQLFQLKLLRARVLVGFAALAIPVLAVAYVGTLDMTAAEKLFAVVIGIILATAQLFVTAFMHFKSEMPGGQTAARVLPSFGFLQKVRHFEQQRSEEQQDLRNSTATRQGLSQWPELSAGVLRGSRLRSGHLVAATTLFILLIAYVVIGIAYRPSVVSPESQPAALFYLLFLILILTWMFSGLSFFMDKLRLPVLTTVLVFSLVTGALRTDHQFKIVHLRAQTSRILSPREVVEQWKGARGRAAANTITVVATAGGGIRAAAWTTRVLTGLEEKCKGSFSSSLVLVSAVSGGSVGAMFFLAPYNSTGKFPDDASSLGNINFDASRSSLSSVGWGLLYPDLDRTAPLFGSLVPQTFDRGWALENSWVTGWKQPPNISDWIHDVASGTRPAVIFNGTVAENGERFLIGSGNPSGKGAIRFPEDYPGWDTPVATAARLSATFTYVSPIARASDGPKRYRVHVADGGYYDNSGILSAIEWLKDAAPSLHGFRILFIVIDADPKTPAEGREWSWQRQIVAPVETLVNVRTSSQEFRDDLELGMMLGTLQQISQVEIFRAIFPFRSATLAPLSWHLNRDQRAAIKDAWNDEANATLLQGKKTAFQVLECSNK